VSQTRRTRFEGFYRSYYESVMAYALRRTGRTTAEDVVAETFLTAWRRLDELPAQPLPWLYGVARRVIGNYRRGEGRREALRLKLRQPWVMASMWRRVDPIEQAIDEAELLEAFATLSNLDREVLSLVAWEGLNAGQAAEVLNCSSGAFAVRLHRARKRLAQALEGARQEVAGIGGTR
jgi:RNA polymerase sigma-70 factor (ECF subfamily)